MFDTLVHNELLGEKRTHAGGNFCIERTRIRARDLHADQLSRVPGLQMFSPKSSEFHDSAPGFAATMRGNNTGPP